MINWEDISARIIKTCSRDLRNEEGNAPQLKHWVKIITCVDLSESTKVMFSLSALHEDTKQVMVLLCWPKNNDVPPKVFQVLCSKQYSLGPEPTLIHRCS